MTEIVARWEWRAFGERFDAAEKRLAPLTPERAQDFDEVYVLALDSDASSKVRDGLVDVKTLAGFGARRFAVIDVSTNSVKYHVGECSADGAWRTITDRAEITRLGEGVAESGRLGGEPIAAVGTAGMATYDPGAVRGATRAEVMLAGACTLRSVRSKLGREALTVSDRGPRHGVRAERFE